MQQTPSESMSLKERVLRILNNLAYLLGVYLSRGLQSIQSLKGLVEKFILGWTEGCPATT
jgi:hypothetical protein